MTKQVRYGYPAKTQPIDSRGLAKLTSNLVGVENYLLRPIERTLNPIYSNAGVYCTHQLMDPLPQCLPLVQMAPTR